MPKRLSTVALALLSACGSSTGTDPRPTPTGTPALAVVGGNRQSAAVTTQLPQLLDVVAGTTPSGVRALRFTRSVAAGGSDTVVTNITPIKGAIVNFVVLDPAKCGRPFAGSALTDTTGHAKERWVLGVWAGRCVMEARMVDQKTGAALVVDTITATALPGVARTMSLQLVTVHLVPAGGALNLRGLVTKLVDANDNPIADYAIRYTVRPRSDRAIPPAESAGDVVTFSTPGQYLVWLFVGDAVNFAQVDVQ